jgi:iron complex outermembrane receptor protein
MQVKKILLRSALAGAVIPVAASADDVGKVFELGQVTVAAPAESNSNGNGGAVITRQQMELFNRNTLDEAINLVPGASISEVGARNESDIWLRGFDRWRVPLYIDGIPIYLPADNRIDFRRFTTSDISQIQVSKGYTSVIDGPGALGGSVNLVSRQVDRPLEGDARLGSGFDSDGQYTGTVADAFVGGRFGHWFVQGAASDDYQQHFRLSHDFSPGPYENGGERDRSFANDWKVNVKGGYVTASGDEYSINVINQQGQKDNPLVDNTPPAGAQVRYWTWPAWDKQSVYWLSKTAIDGEGSFVKLRFYYDRFLNKLDSYDDASFTTQKRPYTFDSIYDDHAAGAIAEIDKNLLHGRDTVRASLIYRWDEHQAQEDANAKNGGPWYAQPGLTDSEMTYSGALENIAHLGSRWDVTAGVSYDYRHMIEAHDYDTYSPVPATPPYGAIFSYPVADKYALNPELATVYRYSDSGSLHANVTERTRFPTIFEMFSSKFGQAVGNAYLSPEKSVNTEIGVADTWARVHYELNLFHSLLRNGIEAVPVTFPAPIGNTTQSQNVGNEIHQGAELSLRTRLLARLDVGGNYSYIDYRIKTPGFVAADVPRHKLFAYAQWRPLSRLEIVPSVEVGSSRWLLVNGGTTYYKGGELAIGNLRASYRLPFGASVDVGVNNITDANYEIEDGYHAPGRNYYLNLRYQFQK